MAAARPREEVTVNDPDILDTTTGLVRFVDGTSVLVTIHHHRNERGDYYVAHAPWPGLDYELHLSGNTARFAIERLVATGISNAASEAGCGVREVYMPGDVPLAEVTRLRAALDDLAHAHERDLMRVAVALGFDHEPPPDVDALVAAAERDHELADMVGANQAMAARETGRAVLLEDERDAAIAEVERLRAVLAALTAHENTRGHAHELCGVWDDRAKDGSRRLCARCHLYADARSMVGLPRWSTEGYDRLVARDAEHTTDCTHADNCGCGTTRRGSP